MGSLYSSNEGLSTHRQFFVHAHRVNDVITQYAVVTPPVMW